MDDLKLKLKGVALKHAEALAKDLLVELAFPALKVAVEKSESKIDDMVLAALEEPMKKAILEIIENIDKA
jgi:hypothetical protein